MPISVDSIDWAYPICIHATLERQILSTIKRSQYRSVTPSSLGYNIVYPLIDKGWKCQGPIRAYKISMAVEWKAVFRSVVCSQLEYTHLYLATLKNVKLICNNGKQFGVVRREHVRTGNFKQGQ